MDGRSSRVREKAREDGRFHLHRPYRAFPSYGRVQVVVHRSCAAPDTMSRSDFVQFVQPFVQPLATVISGLVIACGAIHAARSFEPMFASAGGHVWNLRHVVEVSPVESAGLPVDDSPCTVIFVTSESVIVDEGTPQMRQAYSHRSLVAEDCVALRRSLEPYFASATVREAGFARRSNFTDWIVVFGTVLVLVAVGTSFWYLRREIRVSR